MNDTLAVHVLDGAGYLDGVEPNLGLGEALSSLHHVHEGAVGTELEHQEGAVDKRKRPEELDNVPVPHLGMDL